MGVKGKISDTTQDLREVKQAVAAELTGNEKL